MELDCMAMLHKDTADFQDTVVCKAWTLHPRPYQTLSTLNTTSTNIPVRGR